MSDDMTDDELLEAAEEDEPAAPRSKPRAAAKGGPGARRRTVLPALLGLVLIGTLGAGGYFVFLAPAEGEAGVEATSGFDFSALPVQEWLSALPFLGPKDNDESVAILQDNAALVKRAVDAHIKETGKPPATGAAIERQLKKMGKSLTHPYKPGEPVPVEMGEAPSGPAAVAYSLTGKRYTLRVGAIDGLPLAIEEQEFTLGGRLAGAPVKAPRPRSPVVAQAQAPAPAKAAVSRAPAPRASSNAVAAGAPDDATLATPRPVKPNLPRPKRLPTPPPVAAATPTPAPIHPHYNSAEVRRNQEFDRWRIQGMALVYEKRTEESLVAFRRALQLKPNDPAVTAWVGVIQDVIDKHTAIERLKYEEARAKHMADLARAAEQAARLRPAPRPAAPGEADAGDDEATRIYNELKREKAPLLAPPNLDE